jgi:hypothetical protein
MDSNLIVVAIGWKSPAGWADLVAHVGENESTILTTNFARNWVLVVLISSLVFISKSWKLLFMYRKNLTK